MDNINIRISDSTFQDYENSAENGHLTWAMQNRKRTIKKNIIEANQACNGTMHFFVSGCILYEEGSHSLS